MKGFTLIGSIFYHGQPKVFKNLQRPERGINEKTVLDLILEQESQAQKYGISSAFDIIAYSPTSMKKQIEVVMDFTGEKTFLIDSDNPKTRIEGLRYAKESGLDDIAFYNSLSPLTSTSEMKELKKLKPQNLVVQLVGKSISMHPKEKTRLFEQDLFPLIEDLDPKKILVDVGMVAEDVGVLPFMVRTVKEVKKYVKERERREGREYYVGCASGHLTAPLLRRYGDSEEKLKALSAVGVILNSLIRDGVDFLLYGPIEDARYIFYPCKLALDNLYLPHYTLPKVLTKANILSEINLAMEKLDSEATCQLVRKALEFDTKPKIILQSLARGMENIGKRFEKEGSLSTLMLGVDLFDRACEILGPHLREGIKYKGKVVIGTIKGCVHFVGKNLVKRMLDFSGYQTYDLGENVDPEKFVERAIKYDADVIAISCLLSTALGEVKRVIDYCKERGLRKRVKIIVGGAAVSKKFAQEVGADGYGGTAFDAPKLCDKLLGIKS
jgi:methanogenic corrinoid protein MtbC1